VQLAVTRPPFGGTTVGWELASAMTEQQQRLQARTTAVSQAHLDRPGYAAPTLFGSTLVVLAAAAAR
jgi:hypothetical protein